MVCDQLALRQRPRMPRRTSHRTFSMRVDPAAAHSADGTPLPPSRSPQSRLAASTRRPPNQKYNAGSTKSVRIVELMSPPMTTVASGR